MNASEKIEYMKQWRARNPSYHSDWYRKNKTRIAELAVKWKKANPDKVKASFKRWRERHKDQEKLRFKKFYDANRIALLERQARLRRENPVETHAKDKKSYDRNKSRPEFILKNRDRVKRYTKLHPESKNHFCHKRRAKIRGCRVGKESDIRKFMAGIRKSKRVACYYCHAIISGKLIHFDHVIPIARGGAHAIENLCCSCRDCNIQKGARLPSEFSVNGQATLSL